MTKFPYDAYSPTQMLANALAEADETLMFDLVTARRKAGMTQTDVADLLGWETYEVREFEAGDPSMSSVRRYALAVGVMIHHEVFA